jgi:hypothetical protein
MDPFVLAGELERDRRLVGPLAFPLTQNSTRDRGFEEGSAVEPSASASGVEACR